MRKAPPSMLWALFVGLAVAVNAAPVSAADAVKPLRVIVYDVTYASTTVRLEHTSGLQGGPTTGSGIVDRRFGHDDRGTLTVSIVAATGDGGLVADASFTGKTIVQPTIRVAILSDGRLSYDPRTALSPEATAVLPFLARGLIAEHDVNDGSSWSVPAQPPAVGGTTYKVVAFDGVRATLDIQAAIATKGASSFTESTLGRTTIMTDLLSPILVDLHSTIRREVNTELSDTTESYLTAKLRSDSFARQ